MACIHFILPNMSVKGHAATPKTARVPHYQCTLLDVQETKINDFLSTGGIIDFKIYLPDKDYSNNFLHVINSGVDGIAAIDWDALAQLADKKETGDKTDSTSSRTLAPPPASALPVSDRRRVWPNQVINQVPRTLLLSRPCWRSVPIQKTPTSSGCQMEL
jgi:hypothetical protein